MMNGKIMSKSEINSIDVRKTNLLQRLVLSVKEAELIYAEACALDMLSSQEVLNWQDLLNEISVR